MKTYFTLIKISQTALLAISILMLATLPGGIVLYPNYVNNDLLYFLAHTSLFLVMIVRPLADLMPGVIFVRPLVILRKGMGVFSAAIIVSFILAKIIIDPVGYLSDFGTTAYWSMTNLALLAHLADISAVLLLVTSNNLSKRLMGPWWKRLQKLSYVYFYGSGLYVVFSYQDIIVLDYMIVVTVLTLMAYIVKTKKEVVTS